MTCKFPLWKYAGRNNRNLETREWSAWCCSKKCCANLENKWELRGLQGGQEGKISQNKIISVSSVLRTYLLLGISIFYGVRTVITNTRYGILLLKNNRETKQSFRIICHEIFLSHFSNLSFWPFLKCPKFRMFSKCQNQNVPDFVLFENSMRKNVPHFRGLYFKKIFCPTFLCFFWLGINKTSQVSGFSHFLQIHKYYLEITIYIHE